MAAPANEVKIGAFVLLGLAALLALASILGIKKLHRDTVTYLTYFDESVEGLEVGAPVKARGVAVGQVGEITFAPDQHLVEVRSDLDVKLLKRLGLSHERMPPDIRAQLDTQGLLGNRFVSLDRFEPQTHPPPKLSFPTPEHYIPAVKSTQQTLVDSVSRAMNDLSAVLDALVADGFGERSSRVVTHADELLVSLNKMFKGLDEQKLPEQTAAALRDARTTVNKLGETLDRVNGEGGLLASTQRAVTSIGNAGNNAAASTHDLDETLSQIREAAAAIRYLADAIERDPDMLLKGRARAKSP